MSQHITSQPDPQPQSAPLQAPQLVRPEGVPANYVPWYNPDGTLGGWQAPPPPDSFGDVLRGAAITLLVLFLGSWLAGGCNQSF